MLSVLISIGCSTSPQDHTERPHGSGNAVNTSLAILPEDAFLDQAIVSLNKGFPSHALLALEYAKGAAERGGRDLPRDYKRIRRVTATLACGSLVYRARLQVEDADLHSAAQSLSDARSCAVREGVPLPDATPTIESRINNGIVAPILRESAQKPAGIGEDT
jgi:hypothetical protein